MLFGVITILDVKDVKIQSNDLIIFVAFFFLLRLVDNLIHIAPEDCWITLQNENFTTFKANISVHFCDCKEGLVILSINDLHFL